MKKWFSKYAVLVLVIAVVVIAGSIAGVTAVKRWQNGKDKSADNKGETFRMYEREEVKSEDLGSPSDIGVMLVDGDDESYFTASSGFSITHAKDEYVQGTGAMKLYSLMKHERVTCLFPEKDISAYKDGSVHVSFYLNTTKGLEGQIHVELSSAGKNDEDELEWRIPTALLKEGWNDIYLAISDATVKGNPNLEAINYWDMFMSETSALLRLKIDSIYASNTPGTSLVVEEYASTKDGYLLDFDTLDGLASGGIMKLTTHAKEHKEGVGAVYVNQTKDVWVAGKLRPVNMSKHAEEKISFWVYVDNAAQIKDANICVEISSSGGPDKNELNWRVAGSSLSRGWNEVSLNLSNASKAGGDINLSKVNFFRIYASNMDPALKLIVDAVRYSESVPVVPANGMLMSCDDTKGYFVGSDCTFSLSNMCMEGSGSYQATGNKVTWWYVTFDDRLDVSAYKNGGLHLWLYVDDVNALDENGVIHVEIGSAAKADQKELEWQVDAAALETGWNELYLYLEDAMKSPDGGADLGGINWFRMFYKGKYNKDVTVRLDDVRMADVSGTATENIPGMIYDCDSRDGVSLKTWSNVVKITTAAEEHKQGSGALKSTGTGDCWFRVVKKKAVDVSAYKDGGISFWMYVSEADLAKIDGNIQVEISSSGTNDKEEYQWTTHSSLLEAGWNEVTLYFKDATVSGTPDLSQIDFMRVLYKGKYTVENDFIVILDDVHAVKADEGGSGEVDTQKPGYIYDCDKKTGVDLRTWSNDVTVTTVEGEYKEGIGALKSVFNTGNGDCWFRIVKNKAVDISEYKDGGISFWLYISETDLAKINGTIQVEISSSGENDKEEYQWSKNVSTLKAGWNEVTLYFKDAMTTGTPNLKNINFVRVLYKGSYTNGTGFTAILDAIHAVEAKQEESVEEKPGYIYSCDKDAGVDLRTWSNDVTITTVEGEYKEGIGALKSVFNTGNGDCWFRIVKNKAVDISEYKDGGISFWLYVSETDLAKINGNVQVEISSSGKNDVDEYQWSKNVSTLKAGWNEVTLYFKDAMTTGTPNLKNINFVRVLYKGSYTNGIGFTAILDAIHAVEAKQEESVEEKPGYIYSCDKDAGVDLRTWSNDVTITTVEGEYKEGTGALKSTGTGNVWFRGVREKAVDISAYQKGISFWLYISEEDLNAISGTFGVEIGSGGNQDTEEYEWQRNVSTLTAGWNQIVLKFADDPDGLADLSKINFFRIWFSGAHASNDFTVILDDIRALKADKPGMFYDGDSTDGVTLTTWSNTVSVTTTAGEFNEGTGALKSVFNALPDVGNWDNNGDCWLRIVKSEPVDLSAYAGGGISFQLYISSENMAKLTDDAKLMVELGSNGDDKNHKYRWDVDVVKGDAGQWHTFTLNFADAQKTGTPDLSKLNFMRVVLKGTDGGYVGGAAAVRGTGFTVFLDDIHAVEAQKADKPGMFYDGDSTDGVTLTTWSNTVSVTTTAGEFKEGTGALKSVFNALPDVGNWDNNGDCWLRIVKSETVDLSAYAQGGISFQLYISSENMAKLTDDAKLMVELGSNGDDKNHKYRWDVDIVKGDAGQWHTFTLNFADADVVTGTPNLSKLNFMRVVLKGTDGGYVGGASAVRGTGFTVLLDDIHAVEAQKPVVFYNGDSTDGVTLTTWSNTVSVTTTAGEFKEGTGALKSVFNALPDVGNWDNNGDCWFRIVKSETVDLSAYAQGGISFQVYISSENMAKLTDDAKLMVELGSNGDDKNHKYRWDVDIVKGDAGQWHTFTLNFADADVVTGTPNLSKLNFMRVVLKGTDGGYVGGAAAVRGTGFTALLDDIRGIKNK